MVYMWYVLDLQEEEALCLCCLHGYVCLVYIWYVCVVYIIMVCLCGLHVVCA